MLSPYRVLDLTDDRGHHAGLVLAQLGADVIAVEPPGGHRSRRQAPFVDDRIGPESSLTHSAYSRGKRSVVIDDPGQLEQLARGADILIESGAIAVDLQALRDDNPALVTVSITPFGCDGPKAHWAATDLTINASSGTMSLTGDADRPPVRITFPETWHFAALDACCAALIALWERNRSGLGQHTDVSAQASYISTNMFQMMYPFCGQSSSERIAGGLKFGSLTLQVVYPCRDGAVSFLLLFGPMFGPYTARFFEWLHEEGRCGREWVDKDWVGFGLALTDDPEVIKQLDEATRMVVEFCDTKTKAELFEESVTRGLLFAPCTTTRDVLQLEHFIAREYWDDVDGFRYPGPFAKATVPLKRLGRAPKLGEHTAEVLDEARTPSVPASAGRAGSGDLPLSGVHVLDFCWALAGPGATRILADHGATVVRVESQTKVDVMRGMAPFLHTDGGPEDALHWHSANASKLGFTIDLTAPGSRPVMLDLVRWADVVTDSFAPGKLAALGYGYDDLREVNPGIIALSSSMMGQTGPQRHYAGMGTMGGAIAGFYELTGWPDRTPCGPWGAYSDYPSIRYTVAVLMAALEWHRRTGEGQYIDFSHIEGAVHLLAPGLLDDEVNGRTPVRRGNEDPHMAPHGVYPVRGLDRWIAIACEADEDWHALARLLGAAELAGLDTAQRFDRRAELDELISAWTEGRDGAELETELQAAGVPAHRVQKAEEVIVDEQLAHWGYFNEAAHPIHGTTYVEAPAFRLHRTPGRIAWAGPTFGQHLWEVLTEILAYDEDKAADLIATGIFE